VYFEDMHLLKSSIKCKLFHIYHLWQSIKLQCMIIYNNKIYILGLDMHSSEDYLLNDTSNVISSHL